MAKLNSVITKQSTPFSLRDRAESKRLPVWDKKMSSATCSEDSQVHDIKGLKPNVNLNVNKL